MDGTPVAITTTAGTLLQTETSTTNGHARAMLAAGDQAGTAMLSATSGSVRAETQITFAVPEPGPAYTVGARYSRTAGQRRCTDMRLSDPGAF